jgi:hypothetical protein
MTDSKATPRIIAVEEAYGSESWIREINEVLVPARRPKAARDQDGPGARFLRIRAILMYLPRGRPRIPGKPGGQPPIHNLARRAPGKTLTGHFV